MKLSFGKTFVVIIIVLVLLLSGVFVFLHIKDHSSVTASSINYSAKSSSDFAELNGGLIIAGTSGLNYFDRDGTQLVSEYFLAERPCAASGSNKAVFYDIGGTTVKLFNTDGVIKNITTDNPVISADINREDKLCVCTSESGYKGLLLCYDKSGENIFKWFSASAHVLKATAKCKSNEISVLTVSEEGTSLVKLRSDSDVYSERIFITPGIAFDVAYFGEKVLVFTDHAVYAVEPDNSVSLFYNLGDAFLCDYGIGTYLSLIQSDYKTGGSFSLFSFDKDGNQTNSFRIDSSIVSLSVFEESTACLTDKGLYIITIGKKGPSTKYFREAAGVHVFLCSQSSALVAALNGAKVFQ